MNIPAIATTLSPRANAQPVSHDVAPSGAGCVRLLLLLWLTVHLTVGAQLALTSGIGLFGPRVKPDRNTIAHKP